MKKMLILSLLISFALSTYAQVSKTVSLVTAGTLSTTLTADELNTVTNLTITGNIDARDFKTMRDLIPVLAELDLSGATIVEYQGNEGTEGGVDNLYLTNEVPKYSFRNPATGVSKSSLTVLKLPLQITSISYAAFKGCTGLITMNIPEGVRTIRNAAFENCSNLVELKCNATAPPVIPWGMIFTGIDKQECKLLVPTGSKTAYQAAYQWMDFQNIVEMEPTFEMPLTVTAGGLAALLPQSVRDTLTYLSLTGTIDASDFKTMRDSLLVLANLDLQEVNIVEYTGLDGTSIWGNSNYYANIIPEFAFEISFWNGKKSLTSVILPSTITEIGKYAFCACSALISVKIPESVEIIQTEAFSQCQNMDTIYIPKSVYYLNDNVFGTNSAYINVDFENQIYSSINGVLFNKEQTILISCPTAKVGSYSVPESVRSIKKSAFENCSKLTSIDLSKGINFIENFAFRFCVSLEDIVLPEGLTSIGSQTFFQCKNLSSIYIPSSVITLGLGAISYCENLKTIKIGSTSPANFNLGENVFWAINKTTCSLYVPSGAKAAYQAADQWKDFQNIEEMEPTFEMPLNVTAGGLAALLPQSVRDTLTYLSLTGTIDARDFKTMRDSLPLLANLDLSGVSIVEYNGTEGTSIQDGTSYPANAIPEFAFCNSQWQGKTSLNSIEFPPSITLIQLCAFVRCSNIKILNIPEGVITIVDAAFSECKGLTTINIPSSVSNIRDDAFRDCTGHVFVNELNANYSSIDGVLFNKDKTYIIHCPIDRTGEYIIPESVTNIGWIAFENCKDITSITIPSSVNEIGVYAFMMQNGSNLSELITLSKTPITFHENALVFEGIDKTTCSLYVPNGSKAAYQAASHWKNFHNIVELSPVDLDSGLVAYYPFNGNANDESGNGFNGTLEGQVSFENGAIGDAARFNGNSVGDYIIAEQSYPDSMSQITISAWVKVTDFDMNCWSGSEAILSCGHPNSDNFFGLSVSRNEEPLCGSATSLDSIGFRLYIADNVFFDTKKEYSPDNWYHVVGLYDGKSVKIIVNNSVAVNREIVYHRKLFAESRFLINKHEYYSNGRMGGLIDELRLYNRALNAIEIDSLYREGENVTESNIELRKGLLAYYPFNGNTLDESGNGNDGEMRGTPEYVPGSLGNCIRLEGTNNNAGMTDEGDHIVLPSFDFTTSNQFSYSIWVNEESMTWWHGTGYLFLGDGYAGNAAIAHYGDYTNGAYVGFSSGATNASPDSDPSHPEFYLVTPFDGDNKWVHYALSFKNDTIYAYRDGVLVGTKYQKLKISGDNAGIACHWWDNGNAISTRFTGLIDEVRIYDRALNPAEIDSLYKQGTAINQPPIANAGPDQIVNEGELVALNGSASYDPDGDSITYLWTAPDGITLSSDTSSQPTFTAPDVIADTTYIFTLVVHDGTTDSTKDSLAITVKQLTNLTGSGNSEDPYLIFTVAELKWMRDKVNNDNANYGGKVYKLMNDLDFTNEGDWMPIGIDNFTIFTGSFDGNGKKIKKIKIESNPSTIAFQYGGIFGRFSFGTITGLSVEWEVLDLHSSAYSGGVAGFVYKGSLIDCHTSGIVSSNCSGGIAGWNSNGNIFNCSSSMNAIGIENAGGIAGENSQGFITNCYATGNISTSSDATFSFATSGGVVGHNNTNGVVENCYAKGKVSSLSLASNSTSYSGGIAGFNRGSVSNCLALSDTIIANHLESSNQSNSSRISYNFNGIITDCFASGTMTVIYGSLSEGMFYITDFTAANHGNLLSDEPVSRLNGYVALNPVFNQIQLSSWIVEVEINNGFPVFGILINQPPVANAGPDQEPWIVDPDTQTTVTLDGTASTDEDGDNLTYQWTAPEGIVLSSITDAKPTFVATTDHITTYTFNLVVNDGKQDSQADQVIITVKKVYRANQPSVANAGPDQTVNEESVVTLDGSSSFDYDSDGFPFPLTYHWTAPSGIILSSASDVKPTFIAPAVSEDTQFTFSLTVSDGAPSNTDTVVIRVLNKSNCQQHFHPVWEGTAGLDHMNLNVIGAKQDGIDLVEGDEIGVFDGELCVGYGKVTGAIGLQNILSIKVSRDDGTGNGFTAGNEVTYRIWNCSDSAEYAVQEVTCYDTELNPITCSPFEASGTAFVELLGISEECFTLEFRTGWNLFSVPVLMDSTNIKSVFQTMIDINSLVKIQNELGSSLENWGIFGGWKNNIGEIGITEGYKIKVNRPDSIQVCGTPVSYPYGIPLQSGWNIIGYPQSDSYNAKTVMQQLIDNTTLVKVQDELGSSLENWGIFGGWKNNIGDFTVGEGYKVKVNAPDTLWIYESYPKSTTLQPEILVVSHFRQNYTGNGVDHMNINLVGLPINAIQAGDELAVFEGEACVGAVTLTQHNIENQAVQLTASAFDGQVAGGFTEGRQFTLKLWSLATGEEYTLTPEILSGSNRFMKHETTIASLEKYAITGLDGIAGVEGTAVRCYPNPFSESVTIEINLTADAGVEVEVLNQLGQRVIQLIPNQTMTSGVHQVIWQGINTQGQPVTPGLYHLRVSMNKSVLHRKLVITE